MGVLSPFLLLSRCFQTFLQIRCSESLDEVFQMPFQDGGKIAEILLNPVIAHAVLGKIVGPDFLRSIAGTDLSGAKITSRLRQALLFRSINTTAEERHREYAVLSLAPFGLTGDGSSSWKMCDTHGRLSLIDVLTTGTSRAKRIDAQIFGADLEIHFLRFRENRHGRRGRMDSSLIFGCGNTLHAMDTALKFEIAEDAFPGDLHNRLLQSPHVGGTGTDKLRFPTFVLCEA